MCSLVCALLRHFKLFSTCTYNVFGNSPLAIESCHLWRLDAFPAAWAITQLRWKAGHRGSSWNELQTRGWHLHTHRDVPAFGIASITATCLFGGPKNFKNTYFSYGFEGALVSWCGGGLGVCQGIEGFLLILAPAVSSNAFEPWPGRYHTLSLLTWAKPDGMKPHRVLAYHEWCAGLNQWISRCFSLTTRVHLVVLVLPIQ